MNFLTEILTSTWCDEIKLLFEKGAISSERQLQAEWFSILKVKLPEYEIFVEAVGIKHVDGNEMVPDLIITHKTEIVAILELKFQPHSYIKYNRDQIKLTQYSLLNRTGYHLLRTDPSSGEYDTNYRYTLSDQLKIIFAGIGRENSYGFKSDIWYNLSDAIVLIGYYSLNEKQSHFMRL